MNKWLAGFMAAALIGACMPAVASEYGELTLTFGLDGRKETLKLTNLVGVERKTPRKRAPMQVASWRQEAGAPRSPSFESTFIQFNVSEQDPADMGVSLLLERKGKFTHYGTRCKVSSRPPCDPSRNGVSHDPAAKRVRLKNVEFHRVTLDDADPRDTVTVSGELRYAE